MKSQKSAHLSVVIISVLFFFSGVSALIYEVTWARKLSLVFGTDTYAVATIIAVFFSGLALGSFLFGRMVDRSSRIKNPLYLYGLLELGIGLYALSTPWIFKLIEGIQISFWRSFEPSFGGFSLFALLLSFLGLLMPTLLMGGTLPVISKVFMRINTNGKEQMEANEKIGSSVGSLYAVNTVGAVLGVFTAGFLLIVTLGVNQAIWAAAGISLLVGVIALGLSRVNADKGRISTDVRAHQQPIRAHQRSILLAFGLAGFAAIALEVLWTRVFIMVIGGSVYAFSLVLIAFLIGIAVGSAVVTRYIGRLRSILIWFASVEMLLGITVILLIPVFGNLSWWFLSIFKTYGSSFGNLQFGLWLMSVAVMLVPTFLMGAAFPIVVKAYQTQGIGERVGRVYAANTFGGVFGALAAGFLLIPIVGVQKGILIAGFIYLTIGAWMFFLSNARKSFKVMTGVILSIFLMVGFRQESWNRYILSSGFYVNPQSFIKSDKSSLLRNLERDEILYEAEGISAHVAVRRQRNGRLNLRINGKTDASTGADMENQLLLGHLPLLLHKNPKEILVVGMGSGITLGSVLSHPVERVDTIEIEKEVVKAAGFFSEYSNDALNDPRVNIIIADGRNFLLSSQKKYDVISSEPSNPWLSGSSKLFTKDYFELLKKGAKEQGVVLHWINLYSLDLDGLKSVLAAFQEVFPNVLVFGMPASNDLVLIGTQEQVSFDFSTLSQRLKTKSVANDLAKIGISDPYEILAYFLFENTTLETFVGSAQPNTDNYPFVEFSAPKFLYSPVPINPWRVILDNLSPISSIVDDISIEVDKAEKFRKSRLLTQINFIERNIGEGIEEGEKALVIDGDNPFLAETVARLYFEEGSSFLNQGKYAQAIESFGRSLELKKAPETYVNLGLSYSGLGNSQKARTAFEVAIKVDDEFEIAYFELGQVLGELGDLNGAIEAYKKTVKLNSQNTTALINLGNLYILRKDFGKAEQYLNRALKEDPDLQEAIRLLRTLP